MNTAPATHLRTPWTTDAVLDNSICVLLPQYLTPREQDDSVCFYAAVGNAVEINRVKHEDVVAFLAKHRDRSIITYDAVAFHDECMQAVSGARQLVWDLSRQSLLWDVALLEQRIIYATGLNETVAVDLKYLVRKWLKQNQDNIRIPKQVKRLRDILIYQMDHAVHNLPLFKRLVEPSHDDFLKFNIDNDRYCNEIESREQQSVMEQLAEQSNELGIDRRLHPSEISKSNLDTFRTWRRVSTVLSASNGPLGIGSDLKDALLARFLNSHVPPVDSGQLTSILRSAAD